MGARERDEKREVYCSDLRSTFVNQSPFFTDTESGSRGIPILFMRSGNVGFLLETIPLAGNGKL